MVLSLVSALQASWQATAAAAALLGVASHHIAFRPYEIDGAGWELVFGYIGTFFSLWVAYVQLAGFSVAGALLRTLLVATSYNVSVTASILVYRAFFHRLGSFPGPFAARLSRFYAFEKATRTNRSCEDVQKLHEQYGDFVRVGTSG
jgi:hypothetical protein